MSNSKPTLFRREFCLTESLKVRTFRWAILRLSIIASLGIETQANKIKLRTSSEGAMKSRGALSARWERVSRQSSPFQGREPLSSRRRRGKRQSKEDHLSLQTVALVLRHFLGKSRQDLLLLSLLSATERNSSFGPQKVTK